MTTDAQYHRSSEQLDRYQKEQRKKEKRERKNPDNNLERRSINHGRIAIALSGIAGIIVGAGIVYYLHEAPRLMSQRQQYESRLKVASKTLASTRTEMNNLETLYAGAKEDSIRRAEELYLSRDSTHILLGDLAQKQRLEKYQALYRIK